MRKPGFSLILRVAALAGISLMVGSASAPAAPADSTRFAEAGKVAPAFYSQEMVDLAVEGAEASPSAAEVRDRIVEQASPWIEVSEEELWSWVFGPAITRSWMVWSGGEDPETGDPVVMYDWEIDPFAHPWKVKSPVTGKLYPTNDFEAFHNSGLDERGFFDPALADRSLLYNQGHPDPDDPLHRFGVDDGEGYVDGDKRWRFIGAYLIYGQWKGRVVDGIVNLSEAYSVTGEPVYARKAAILLDRVADVYPEFDFSEQGLVYENPGIRGTVSTWHDAAREVRALALAYDRIFEAMAGDEELVEFLSAKAAEYDLENRKSTIADIRRNIEERIFQETLHNPHQIRTNFPGHLITLLMINTVMEWPENRDQVIESLEDILAQSLLYDGLTGERGLQGYSRVLPGTMAELLLRFDRMDPTILPHLFDKFPDLRKTWRFHIDTKVMELFYPAEGDSGIVGRRYFFENIGPDGKPTPPPHHHYYHGATLSQTTREHAETYVYRFLWRLHELTGDADYVKLIWKINNETLEGLPGDVYAADYREFQQQVRDVLDEEGHDIILGDVNLEEWGISILRAGNGPESMALAFRHHVGGSHQHYDGLNIELFYKGVNLLPDLGYPPVAYLNEEPRRRYDWFKDTASHNTIVVDGRRRQVNGTGETTLWAGGREIHAVRVEAPEIYEVDRYERLLVMMETGGNDAYVADLFTVHGGEDHIRSYIPFFSGETVMEGLAPVAAGGGFEFDWLIKDVATDPSPDAGWFVDWKYEDRFRYLEEGRSIHLRYTGLNDDVEVSTALSWTDTEMFGGSPDWLPRLMERRRERGGNLESRFVGILEPHEGTPLIRKAQRRPLLSPATGAPEPDSTGGAIHVELTDGRTHVIAHTEPHAAGEQFMVEGIDGFRFQGEVAIIKLGTDGVLEGLALMNGTSMAHDEISLSFADPVSFVEMAVEDGNLNILTLRTGKE